MGHSYEDLERSRKRRQTAVDLRRDGYSSEVIAERLGISLKRTQQFISGIEPRRFADEASEAQAISNICAGASARIILHEIEADQAAFDSDEPERMADLLFVTGPEQEKAAGRSMLQRTLRRAVERAGLSEVELCSLVEVEVNGKTTREAGEMLGVSRQAVLNRYRMAKIKLLTVLEPEQFGFTQKERAARLRKLIGNYMVANGQAKNPGWIKRAYDVIEATS